jgi:hypothetical protein
MSQLLLQWLIDVDYVSDDLSMRLIQQNDGDVDDHQRYQQLHQYQGDHEHKQFLAIEGKEGMSTQEQHC